MKLVSFDQIKKLASEPAQWEKTIEYLTEQMRSFVHPDDKVLCCFPDDDGSVDLLLRALKNLGAIPVMLNGDLRWKNILRVSFSSRATVFVGPPLTLLGLTKLSNLTNTPLFFRQVITAGYPCLDWMIDGIRRGLDCQTWGCFDPGGDVIVAGFSCNDSLGVHIRDDQYEIEIWDEEGSILPVGETGSVILKPCGNRDIGWNTMQQGYLDIKPCACGRNSPRLLGIYPARNLRPEPIELVEQLYSLTSVLDCVITKSECGLELIITVFPGMPLPEIPFCARKLIRPWNPDKDTPYQLNYMRF